MCFSLCVTLERQLATLTGSNYLKVPGHSALPGKLSSAFPFLSVVYSKITEKYQHWRGNLKEAYEVFSPEKEQVAVL